MCDKILLDNLQMIIFIRIMENDNIIIGDKKWKKEIYIMKKRNY